MMRKIIGYAWAALIYVGGLIYIYFHEPRDVFYMVLVGVILSLAWTVWVFRKTRGLSFKQPKTMTETIDVTIDRIAASFGNSEKRRPKPDHE